MVRKNIMSTITIRLAGVEDAAALLDIYSYYVKNTAVSYEYEVPSLEEFTARVANTLKNYPYLIAEVDGTIAGYIYAGRLGVRKAYDWSAETSVYIHRDYHRMGIGRLLYEKLEDYLRRQNVTNVYAGAADPVDDNDPYLTRNSEHFHEALGYRVIARFNSCGNKFGRWYNLIKMEKVIGEHTCPPKPFIPFPELLKNEGR